MVTEALGASIVGLLEKSIVGGAFIYLLYYMVNKNNETMERISTNLAEFGVTLSAVSQTLVSLEKRIEKLERN